MWIKTEQSWKHSVLVPLPNVTLVVICQPTVANHMLSLCVIKLCSEMPVVDFPGSFLRQEVLWYTF